MDNPDYDIINLISKVLIKDECAWIVKIKWNFKHSSYNITFDNGSRVYVVSIINKIDYILIEYVENNHINFIQLNKNNEIKIGFHVNEHHFGEGIGSDTTVDGVYLTGKNCFLKQNSAVIRGGLINNKLQDKGTILYSDDNINNNIRLDGNFVSGILIEGTISIFAKKTTIKIARTHKKDKYVIEYTIDGKSEKMLDYAMYKYENQNLAYVSEVIVGEILTIDLSTYSIVWNSSSCTTRFIESNTTIL